LNYQQVFKNNFNIIN